LFLSYSQATCKLNLRNSKNIPKLFLAELFLSDPLVVPKIFTSYANVILKIFSSHSQVIPRLFPCFHKLSWLKRKLPPGGWWFCLDKKIVPSRSKRISCLAEVIRFGLLRSSSHILYNTISHILSKTPQYIKRSSISSQYVIHCHSIGKTDNAWSVGFFKASLGKISK